jgi:hypothetical protein
VQACDVLVLHAVKVLDAEQHLQRQAWKVTRCSSRKQLKSAAGASP